ncbi:type II secretion system major pseudopilin GspG [Ruegeria sp. HKCCD8929]|uniref:type II secretion system major pseudopilin GspG n=1 Tax=Ruegeria sp. HKCCD8929 TaxID=2683006 RepID=UPI001488C74F|nr:type II secretion system major pseudopilin GspG [Ruegeria sp. HKCCD8929]
MVEPREDRRAKNAGISLLEIMVVLAVMGLVIGLAAPRLMATFGRAKSSVAQTQMVNLKGALQLFYIDNGRYPNAAEGLVALLEPSQSLPNWRGPYVDGNEDLIDPWGRRYLYRYPGNDGAFDIYSLGRDSQPGGAGEDSDLSL